MTTTSIDTRDNARQRRRDLKAMSFSELRAKPVLTMLEAAKLIGVSLELMTRLIQNGEGPRSFKIGRAIFIRTDSLLTWLRVMEADQTAEKARTSGDE